MAPWFPIGKDDSGAWRLDIVALLAVTGESFVAEHSHAITSSVLGILPRIMPAPHALLRPWRPASLPSYPAKVAGVYSTVLLDTVGFFANAIHPIDLYPPFAFSVLEIRHTPRRYPDGMFETGPRDHEGIDLTGMGSGREVDKVVSLATGADAELGSSKTPGPGLTRRATLKERVATLVSNAPKVRSRSGPRRGPVGASRLFSSLHVLSVFNFLMTIGLVVAAAIWKDGVASSPSASLASPVASSATPPCDIIIRTREGAFLLIRCTEQVARELYSGVQECHYRVGGIKYRLLMVVGAILMMPAVVPLGNCSFNVQALLGAAYIVLNIAYTALGLLPPHYFWDLSRYTINDITPIDARSASSSTRDAAGMLRPDPDWQASYTRTLWYAIREVKTTDWVTQTGAAPATRLGGRRSTRPK